MLKKKINYQTLGIIYIYMKSFPLPLILGHEFEFFNYWKHELLDQPWFKNVLEILDLFGLKIAIFNESQVQFFGGGGGGVI
jgi:hypothetical protein